MTKLFQEVRFLPYCLLACLIVIASCTDKETLTPSETEDLSLQFDSFVFEQKNNPQLTADVVFDIQDGQLNGSLKHYFYKATPTFTTNAQSVSINEVPQISGNTEVDFSKKVTYTLTSASGTARSYTVQISWDNMLANFNITTNGRVPVNSKMEYVAAQIEIDGQQQFNDFVSTGQIRGRGNTTWTFPKKPFKIKLDDEEEILGLAAERDWVLLANYLDGTHMMNAVGMKTAQLLGMPFSNTVIPVEVTLNDDYLGLYMLTEQIEVKKNRVDVGKDGILLNLDTNFDESFQFASAKYRLPVTIKFPKEPSRERVNEIKQTWQDFEDLVAADDFPNNDYLEHIDANSIANYFITYMLTGNEEINHPKSTYLFKTEDGKFHLGPVWDFDWGFAYEGSLQHFSSFDRPLFWTPPRIGTTFFSRFLEDPEIRQLIKENWATFESNDLPELLRYIDDYAFIIRAARARDWKEWQRGNGNFDVEAVSLKNWLSNRGRWMQG
ncbi:MAG: CotH kinase family protein, partial [Bacteroidota bacterium]